MKGIALDLCIFLAFFMTFVNAQEEMTNAPVIDQKRFRIADEQANEETIVTWINSTHLIELVSYLIEQKRTSQGDVVVIDTRKSDEYNGWQSIDNNFDVLKTSETKKQSFQTLLENKNGHISFAHNLDSDWIDLFNSSSLNDFIEFRYGFKVRDNDTSGGVKSRTVPVILYDTDKSRLERVKDFLESNFNIKRIYLCQIKEQEIARFVSKVNDTSLFFREPYYDMLISPDALNAVIRPVRVDQTLKISPLLDYKLFDVSNDELKYHYDIQHIPSAVHLSTDDLESKPLWNRKSTNELAKLLLSYGVKPNNSEMIILYGNPDPMGSFRAAIILKSMGVNNVRVLNGGYQSWFDKFLILDDKPSVRQPIVDNLEENIALYETQEAELKSHSQLIVDSNYVEDLVKNLDLFQDQYALVDIRTYDEYIGEISGYPDLDIKGRIPGSYWGRAGTESNRLEDYRNPDLTMRSGLEILKMWDDLDIDYKRKHLIFYSGNGWRASEVMYYAELMGLQKVSIYDGGWYDWSTKFGKLDKVNENSDVGQDFQNSTELTLNTTAHSTVTRKTVTLKPVSGAVGLNFSLKMLFVAGLSIMFLN